MIYWFTKEKDTHKKELPENLLWHLINVRETPNVCFIVQDADVEGMYDNNLSGIKLKLAKVEAAQNIAKYLNSQGHTIVVNVDSPILSQREEFKELMGEELIEIYLHSDSSSTDSSDYVQPQDNFISIDVSSGTDATLINNLIDAIWEPPVVDLPEEDVEKKRTYFVDLDGTLFVYRKFGEYETTEAEPIQSTVDHIREMKDDGHMIVITTARPESLFDHTLMELSKNDIPFDKLIMGIERGPRYVINDKDPVTDEDKAIAINLDRDKGIV